MKAIIPCAEKEESLYPFTESKPTALIPIAGKPLIKHIISDLQAQGIDDIYIVTNYMEEKFIDEFDGYTNVNTVTQEELNGTGGALETCDFIEDDFLVINGDVVVSENDIKKLIEKHESSDSSATILATTEDKPEKFGVLSIENDRVTKISEKPEEPENPLVNTGVYVFNPEIFDILNSISSEEKNLTEAVQKIVEKDKACFELAEDYWIDIGTVKKLWKADETKRYNLVTETEISEDADIAENVNILGNAVVEKGAEIKPGTVIEGNVFIGENCIIGPNTTLRDVTVNKSSQVRSCGLESTLLFEKNIVDHSTFIENSVIAEESDIKSNTTIRECFIGPRSFIEMNNSVYGVKFVPDARTDLSEISK